MTTPLRLALTADLHWGMQAAGDAATQRLVDSLRREPPDLFILAGDIGTRDHFEQCLALFDEFSFRKALVPGNHDIWVEPQDARGDSLQLYDHLLPAISARHAFHYLDHAPIVLPEAGLAIVGSINWYDYSWSLAQLQATVQRWEHHLSQKYFSRGRHNDANFVRWELDDRRFTERVVGQLAMHLNEVAAVVPQTIVVTHHPPFRGLNFPRTGPATMNSLLWDAFSGNQTLEELLLAQAARIPLAFCGHTHRARENTLGTIRGYNIGGDYDFKRLLRVAWPDGVVTAEEFQP